MILYKDDCLVEMDKIPDGSVDLILTDPPYGTTACKWDSVIPFEPMWKQLNRIIKILAVIFKEATDAIERLSTKEMRRQDRVRLTLIVHTKFH